MIFGPHLAEAVALFNAGKFEDCMRTCDRLLNSENHDQGTVYLAALAAQNIGNFSSARDYLNRIAGKADNQEIVALHAFVDQSLAALDRIPPPLKDSQWLEGKTALRIGGRVRLLDDFFRQVRKLIDVNATTTRFGQENRIDILCDAHSLKELEDASVDVVASSHTIEHLVNPLLALKEWGRVLKPGGHIYSVIPNYRLTFDHRRQLTTLEHLVADLASGSTAPDWFHIVEFLRNHDCEKDLVFKGDKERHMKEFIDAPHLHTHYHVFDLPLSYAMHEYCGFKTLSCFESEISIHYAGIKPAQATVSPVLGSIPAPAGRP